MKNKKIGVLITNLGTPNAPTPKAVKRFLAEFLWDKRVVEIPRLIWFFILRGIILPFRSRTAAKAYQSIWQETGSPLLFNTKELAKALEEKCHANADTKNFKIVLGMRYGEPSIKSALNELRDAGVEKIIVLPLYPQYSAATTASTFDAISKELKNWRNIPSLSMINSYYDFPPYIEALQDSIKKHITAHGKPDKLIFSFHGLPEFQIAKGDPYENHCNKTSDLICEGLDLKEDEWMLCFQSRFGRAKWLQPYTIDTMKTLAENNCEHIAVVCPGFSADCLETLEEIDGENRDVFLENGGKTFHYIPALNQSDEHCDALYELLRVNHQ